MSQDKLRLGPLAKTHTIRLSFSCPANVKADLDRYAALHAQAYGESVDAEALIPLMLATFMARDRGFKAARGGGARVPAPSATSQLQAQQVSQPRPQPPLKSGPRDPAGQ